jgi:hypothetical protein
MVQARVATNSPLYSQDNWTAAIVQHDRTWDDQECEIYDVIKTRDSARFSEVYHYYKITRNLNADTTVRSRLLDKVYAVRLTGADNRARLHGFAENVERIACEIGKLQPKNGRPFSAVSKLLVHLHPIDGFIYDANARQTVKRIRGRPTKIDGLEAYRAFVQDYSNLFCELKVYLTKQLSAQKSTLYPTHIVDKFLWLQGTEKADRDVRRLLRKKPSKRHAELASEITRWLKERQV